MIRLVITVRSCEVAAERDAGQLDAVGGALAGGDRAHERLVAVADVGVHHVEVALVHRHVDRLAHGAAASGAGTATCTRASRSSGSRRSSRSAGRCRGRARTASRSSARTRWRRRRSARCAPGCGRAACRSRGAVACTIWRHMPRGKRTRVPSTVGAGVAEPLAAPTGSRGSRRRPPRGSCRRCARAVSSPSSETISNGFIVRVRNASALDDVRGAHRLPPGAPSAAAGPLRPCRRVLGPRHRLLSCLRRRRPRPVGVGG